MHVVEVKLNELKSYRNKTEGLNHFEVLGVERTADDATVRSAYFDLLKKYGADYFHATTDPDDCREIDLVNQRIRNAYNALAQAEGRQSYADKLDGKVTEDSKASEEIDIATVFEVEQALSQARVLIDRGEFEVALQRLKRIVSLDPEAIEAKARMAYVKYMLLEPSALGKRDANAVQASKLILEETIPLLPNALYLRLYLGDIEKLEGNKDRALTWYKAALAIDANNATAKRAIKLIEDRKAVAKEPQSFWDKFKVLLNKKV